MGFTEVLKPKEGTQFPTRREMAAWAKAYLHDQDFDTIVTYADLTTVLGLDPQRDPRARSSVLKAGRDLLREDHKKLVNLRNVGYRIIKPNEHANQSRRENVRARRRLREALATVTYVAMERLTPAETVDALMEQARVAIQVGIHARLRRIKQLPPRNELKLPSASKLVDMMRRRG